MDFYASVGNEIYNNPSGGILLTNGSTAIVNSNIINGTSFGLINDNSVTNIAFNHVSDCDIGIAISGSSAPIVHSNTLESNIIGMKTTTSGITFTSNNFTTNTDTGLLLDKVDGIKLGMCNFDGDNIGVTIIGGDGTDIMDTSFKSASTTAIMGSRKANFTLVEATMQANTLDMTLDRGIDIPIEQRSPDEVTHVQGVAIAPEGTQAQNPAFDVTPHQYITAIITERGIIREPYGEGLRGVI